MSTCCLPFSVHEGTPTGVFESIFGLDSYIVGDKKSKKVIVLFCDIYGPQFKNLQLIADIFAKQGYFCVCPDILTGDYLVNTWQMTDIMKYIGRHPIDVTSPLVQKFLTTLRSDFKPEFVGAVGYCYGARYVLLQATKDGLIDAGAMAHPSLTEVSEYQAVDKPLLISCAEVDQMFPAELRHLAEVAILVNKVPFEMTLFSGVNHGFAVKGDYSIEAVEYAANKTLQDQIAWFERFSKK